MSNSKYSLEGKVALITGGSRGIGRAIALRFADAGADIVISSRKLPDLEATAEEIKSKGRKALAVASHVAKTEESKNLVETVQKEFGRIDILVNNAGTNVFTGPLIDAEEWAWDVTNNVNLKGPFVLSQMVARIMKEQGGGNIVNIASNAGINPSPLHIYGVTKAGLIMLTKVMASEWAQFNIRANAIAPGVVKTKFSELFWKDSPDQESITSADDVAAAALFLASDESRFINGEVLPIG